MRWDSFTSRRETLNGDVGNVTVGVFPWKYRMAPFEIAGWNKHLYRRRRGAFDIREKDGLRRLHVCVLRDIFIQVFLVVEEAYCSISRVMFWDPELWNVLPLGWVSVDNTGPRRRSTP